MRSELAVRRYGQLRRMASACRGLSALDKRRRVVEAGVTEDIADAELFGHKKGAFTGAGAHRSGIFLAAQRARRLLFLDDVAECSPAVQAKLLAVLDDGVVRPVGSDDVVVIGRGVDRDFRLVSSCQPGSLGKLRPDLLDRLSTIQVWIPPLRRRGLDILFLADHFTESVAGDGIGKGVLQDGARRLLIGYTWPGNVRQLFNVVSRAAFEARRGGPIDEDIMSQALAAEERLTKALAIGKPSASSSTETPDRPSAGPGRFPTMSEVRDHHFQRALDRADGNVKRAASFLDVNPSTVHRWRKTQQPAQNARL